MWSWQIYSAFINTRPILTMYYRQTTGDLCNCCCCKGEVYVCHFINFLNFENPTSGYLTSMKLLTHRIEKVKLARDSLKVSM